MSLKIESLSHTYATAGLQPRTVIQNIDSWELQPGAQVLLRGISGSGKTTLLNILAGLLQPTTGQVSVEERSLYALPEAKRDVFRSRHIGYIFQVYHLLPMLTALENVTMPMVYAGIIPSGLHKKMATNLLSRLELAEFTHHRPAQLSAGQRLRVAVARGLANQPHILLADEPTAALDSASGQLVMDLIQETCRQNQAILLVASHNPAHVNRFEHVIDLKAGQLQFAGTAKNGHQTPLGGKYVRKHVRK